MKQIHIAIVEDDVDDRLFIAMAFEGASQNLRLTAFQSGAEFLDYLQNGHDLPTVILTDIRMPLVNGFDVIRKVKQEVETKNIPVVVLSTSSDQEDIRLAKDLGALDYFIKPISLDAYQNITSKVIDVAKNNFHSFSSRFNKLQAGIFHVLFGRGFSLG